jgi:hypothetical protein
VLAVPPDTPADGEIHQHRIVGPEGKMLGMVERSVRIDDIPDGKPRSFRLIAAADESLMSEPVAASAARCGWRWECSAYWPGGRRAGAGLRRAGTPAQAACRAWARCAAEKRRA